MNVRDLIKLLRECDSEALVLVDGYEGGYDLAHAPTSVKVRHVPGNAMYDGAYVDAKGRGVRGVKGVVLARGREGCK